MEEKIKESGFSSLNVLDAPQGTKFEFSVMQIVIPVDFMH